jgi:hypothetical protein
MERPHGTKVEDWQLGGSVSPDGSAGGLVVHEALQQSINRYALPLRFLSDSRFGLWRDVEAYANSSPLGITLLSHAPLAALSRLPMDRSRGQNGLHLLELLGERNIRKCRAERTL